MYVSFHRYRTYCVCIVPSIPDIWRSQALTCIGLSMLHYRYKLELVYLPAAILDDRKSLSIAFLTISDQYAYFIFSFHKMTPGISRHFISIHNFFFLNIFTKWSPAAILDDRKSLPIAISPLHMEFFFNSFYILEVRFGPFWMSENHFQSHFSPFDFGSPICAAKTIGFFHYVLSMAMPKLIL